MGINFPRERYRLGHTLVFFRAGALAMLEEARDDIVLKLVRYMQGEVLKRMRNVAYDEQVQTKARLLEENVSVKEELKAMVKQLEAEQGNISEYHEKQAKISAQKADLEAQLAAAQELLTQKEQERQTAIADKKVLEQEVTVVKKDIEDIEIAIQKLEQEKTNRDHTIRSLNDEVANQDEVINKLNKEKKHLNENAAKAGED